MVEDRIYLLAQEAYNKMKEKFAHREDELREEIVHKIAVTRAEGDLSEDGGYQAARKVQSKNEGRITELAVKLRDSKIVENAPEGTVGEDSVVTIEPSGNEITYMFSSCDTMAGTNYSIMTPGSPVGEAIEGVKMDDVVSYTAPNGRELSVTIRVVKPLA